MKWILILLLASAAWAQTLNASGSKAGTAFSPTQPWSYSTVQYRPIQSNGTRSRRRGRTNQSSGFNFGYGYSRVSYGRRGRGRSPGSYTNPFGSGPTEPGRLFPSASQETSLFH